MGSLAQGHTVYDLDLPGHGASDNPEWTNRLDRSVEFLLAFVDALSIQRASLVGNFMGGLLALSTALKYPQRVDRLVLEDSVGLGREVAWFLRLMSLPGLGELMTRPRREGVRWSLNRTFSDPSFISEELVESLLRERSRPGNKTAMLRILRRGINLAGVKKAFVLLDRLVDLEVPTLVVWGREDSIFPVAQGERTAGLIPGGRLEVFDECGHWPYLEARDAFNGLLQEF
jgi:4,5:9,10-diseco-3-hydroxy-5,9,17-trioxoandrosta-1(10),2-diene-4-oate hydrolase